MSIFNFFSKKQPEPIIPGSQVQLGNAVYTIAPMNFATLKKVTPLLASFQTLGAMPSPADLDNMITVIWLALLRNHPKLKRSVVENGLDLSNIGTITSQAMSTSGVVQKGEAKAASL